MEYSKWVGGQKKSILGFWRPSNFMAKNGKKFKSMLERELLPKLDPTLKSFSTNLKSETRLWKHFCKPLIYKTQMIIILCLILMMERLYSVPNHMLFPNSLNIKPKTTQPKVLVSWLPPKPRLSAMSNPQMAILKKIQTIKVLNSKCKAILKGQEGR